MKVEENMDKIHVKEKFFFPFFYYAKIPSESKSSYAGFLSKQQMQVDYV